MGLQDHTLYGNLQRHEAEIADLTAGAGTTFASLTDTPGSYGSAAHKMLRVNGGADAVVFENPATITPEPFGAVADGNGAGGGTNDHTALQAAINYALANGIQVLDLQGKTYRCDDTLMIQGSNLTICNGMIDGWHQDSSLGLIRILGSEGASLPLTANTTGTNGLARRFVSMSSGNAATLQPFDIIKVRSDQPWAINHSVTGGEFAVVKSVSGGTVTLFSHLHQRYNTADNARVAKINFCENIRFERLTIRGSGRNTNAVSSGRGIRAEYVKGLRVRDCNIEYARSRGFLISHAFDTVIDACNILYAGIPNVESGYGVSLVNGCQHFSCVNCTFISNRHAISIGSPDGVNRHINFCFNSCFGSWNDVIDSHAPSEYVNFSFNFLDKEDSQTAGGVICQGRNITVVGNQIRGDVSYGVLCQIVALTVDQGAKASCRITDNFMSHNGAAFISLRLESAQQTEGVVIANNSCTTPQGGTGPTSYGIRVQTTMASVPQGQPDWPTNGLSGMSITGNVLKFAGSSGNNTVGIRIENPDGEAINDIAITGNVISMISSNGSNNRGIILLSDSNGDIRRVNITGNTIRMGGGSSTGILGILTQDTLVVGNIILGVGTKTNIAGTSVIQNNL